MEESYPFLLRCAGARRRARWPSVDTIDDRQPRGHASIHARNSHASSSTELQEDFIAQEAQGTEHGIGIDTQDRGRISGGRHPFTRSRLSLGDGATNHGGHLLVESQWLGAVDLDVRDGTTYYSTMSVQAEVRPLEVVTEIATQVLIREARRRQRRRRLIIMAVLIILAMTCWFTARSISTDGSGPVARSLSPKNHDHPIIAAGQFSGFWHFHTTSVTIHTDGQGRVIWPGPLKPGESEATALPGHAELRVRSVSGDQAVALLSGSTVPSEVPDGPVQLRVTSKDLLYVVPAHRTTVSPFDPISFGPTGFCGPKAAALALAQVPGGMNCGA